MKLISFASNQYSQNGEDGIIEKIFERIGPGAKVCIEVGAWDGYHYSNTANLWTKGWKGILIEGNAERAELLTKNIAPYDCIAFCRYVGFTEGSTLEDILRANGIVLEADLLSIDIDGDDYYAFASFSELRPRVILCEYNPTIPYWLDIYAEPGSYFGASIAALDRVGRKKGYRLVAVTETNCIFVREDECAHLEDFTTNMREIAATQNLNFIITSYSGEYFIFGNMPYGLNGKCMTRLGGDEQVRATIESNRNILILYKRKIRIALKEILRFVKGALRL